MVIVYQILNLNFSFFFYGFLSLEVVNFFGFQFYVLERYSED